jgi:hypothetical protein
MLPGRLEYVPEVPLDFSCRMNQPANGALRLRLGWRRSSPVG